ncbi:SWI/SNF chromatin-remodeling complex subunit [Vermiconidia calcicola]|uniref:SWI/SNF chromatin-remodeling complex subunit n=1 Tax=Vermiconidia calcicola TaxID=1690605 RepID=A0ACC3N4L8_9PEZI|nr:SWI/SNF chromatin-remodeling complex subunit [Vermiconidia calcicola]
MSTPQPPSHHQFNGQSYPPSQYNHNSQWNGASGAVQSSDENRVDATSHQYNSSLSGKNAIREGKQKAKETMAAAGITPDASSAQGGMLAQANGGPQLSRKRSRDGTQLPVSQAGSSSSVSGEHDTAHNEILLDRYIQRDLMHGVAMNDQSERSRELVKAKEQEKERLLNDVRQQRAKNLASVFGPGYMGYGNRTTDGGSGVVYSSMRGPPKGRRSRELYIPRKDNAQQAEQHEELVPIRLDIELDKLRLRDTFTWNLHEKLVSQELFTDHLIEDLKVPPEATHEVARQVKAEMQDQIHNFYPHIIVEDGPLEPGRPYNDHKDDEMRIQIKLHITIGRITLIDQFEWDINNPHNSPEEFARQMAWENALSGEFMTAIAHSIREQSQLYTKSLYLTNHCFDGRPVEDPDIKDNFLSAPIHSAFRPHQTQKDWMPYMYEMSEAELERTETSMMREHRAQKRQLNRRGGPALPDLKDRQRTVRSLLVHSVIPGAVDTFETTGIPKTRRTGKGRGGRGRTGADGDVDSDDLDSEQSDVDSPAPSVVNVGTTARTRGMRGAAMAAAAGMRAGIVGRSVTPDLQAPAPHETRTSARRSVMRDESVVEDDTLIVKLKVGRAKLKAFLDHLKAKKRDSEYPLSGYANQPAPTSIPASLQVGTPSRGGSNTPSTTPRSLPQPRSTPQPNGGHQRAPSSLKQQIQPQIHYDEHGGAEADHWPHPDEAPPPPPPWLNEAIKTLRQDHFASNFEAIMRPYSTNVSTGQTEKLNLEPGAAPPPGVKLQFLPRIRCNDCPGKLYTAQPGRVVEDFQVHLRNRKHRESVERRQGGQ